MSDSLREALKAARIQLITLGGDPRPHLRDGDSIQAAVLGEIDAALSSPQAEAEPTQAQVNSACMSYRHDYGLLPPDLQTRTRIEAWKWLRAWQKEWFIAAPPSQSAEMLEALVLAEDVLSRAPFSTGIWPNGMHPQRGIEIIRKALSRADEGKESEGGLPPIDETLHAPEVIASLQQRAMDPSDPTPPDRVPGLNWELSEETKKHLAEIDRAIVRPGDPRLDQLICGPQPNRPAQKSWPNGCRNPNSCSIHRDCMYVGCTNYDRDISGEVDAAIKRGGQ